MNFGKLKAMFVDLTDALVNRRPRNAARIFVLGLRRDVRKAFASATDPVTGAPWKPRKDTLPHPLLVKSGAMMAAALTAADAATPNTTTTVVNLSGPVYAGVHQRGNSRVPQRRFWGVGPETRREATRAYAEDIVALTVGGRS